MLWWTGLALAFTVEPGIDGRPVTWPSFPVRAGWVDGWSGSPALAGGPEAVAESVGTWSSVPGADITLTADAGCAVPLLSPFDGANCVWVVDDWPHDPDLLALASTWSDTRGDILGFDVEVNGARAWTSRGDPGGYDLVATLTHEVGHGIGLEHSDDPHATMFATLSPGDARMRSLGTDDLAGARFLYPSGAAGGCSHAPGMAPRAATALLLLWFTRPRRARLSQGPDPAMMAAATR
jgi:hypothetical protein